MYTFCEKEYWESEDFDFSYCEDTNGRYRSYEEAMAEAKKRCSRPIVIQEVE